MSWPRRFLCLILLALFPIVGRSQLSNARELTIAWKDTIQLDSLTIYPNSFELLCGDRPMNASEFKLDYSRARLLLFEKCEDSLNIRYRVLPMDLSKKYALRDTSLIYTREKGIRDKFLISGGISNTDIFGGTGLTKSGSISRGISFGNNQDLGVNSTLNLELSGQIAPNLKLLASVSDDNLPIQPQGNTNTLREFDQVFIQVYNDQLKLIAGDFWLYKPTGYFLVYKKRAQGLTVNYAWQADSNRVWKTQASGALSRGKFQRQIIQGIEGNQGPYRLQGAQNEQFIVVLSGTERVYIDGKLLERGQEFDYVIDYNTSEVTFTARNQITKDSRIVVEFQYSDQNYARSLVQSSTTFESKRLKFWINGYSEQDAKNQTLQQELSLSQRKRLSEIGDSVDLARISSIDSIGYFENQNLYKLVDSLGFDSVLVYSVQPELAYYRATFQFVGQGNGDYVFSNFNALGKVYKWVAPIAGVSQGDYEPSRLIVMPQQRQMVTSGVEIRLSKVLKLETELAYSKLDINTFSPYDRKDDKSFGAISRLIGDIPLSRDSLPDWKLRTKVEIEARDQFFSPIEQYRAVEFDRDWNVRNKGYSGNQVASVLGANFMHRKHGNLNVEGQHYIIGGDYQGIRTASDGKWKQNGFTAVWDASYLSSKTAEINEYLRHRADVSQQLGWFKVGYKDDHELNKFQTTLLQPSSYQFFDYQFYVSNSDSIKNNYKLFYRERYDQRSDSSSLVNVAKATSIGGEVGFTEWKNQRLTVLSSYRQLKILQDELINQTPENTLLGRVEYELRALKSAITLNNFYEVGSGLELKREFLYVKVNDGQGVYTWIDYNADGIKDLNEFEIAQFVDQASYIRVFTPSNEYVQTYSNEFNQSIYWRPERLWANKKGALGVIARFSDQARLRVNRKTNLFNVNEAFNPFSGAIEDSNLISTNSNMRNTLFFNRTSSIVNAEYTFQNTVGKTLLANGFDSRFDQFNELAVRWNIKRKFTLEVTVKEGIKKAEADYTSGRNFSLDYSSLEPSFIYQPSTVFRITLDARFSEKTNAQELGGEVAKVSELGSTFKYNQAQKGSLQGGFKMISIAYNGAQNSALGFEMLEALKPGVNYTWNVGYQRSLSNSLQLSIQYNGRKSEASRFIHSGGMEIRAFF